MSNKKFTGNIFIFHAFDVGDEINLERITLPLVSPQSISKYFKGYHLPLSIKLPNQPNTGAKIHGFGVITLRYQIPFNETLENLRARILEIERAYDEQSVRDAEAIFEQIKGNIKQARFFHLHSSYVIIQAFPIPEITDIVTLKKDSGATIASLLRFETENLSEYQKNEILATSIGYYRNDLIIIDTEAAFMYDDEYEELLDLFEFANMQRLELQYFDRVLDKQLSSTYERKVQSPPLKAYLPFIGTMISDPVSELGQLKVDISVITERLETSIKLAGEAYYAELYSLMTEKMDIPNWKESINRKLSIIQGISDIYQHKMEALREDILTMSIIVLIFLELLLGLMNVMRH
jgi:hypothetical protein